MRTIVLLLLASFLSGCSSRNQWDEDVQLSTGQVVTVQRETRILRVLLAEGIGSVQEQWFHFKPLKLTWHTENQLEIPLSFDVINDAPYLVTTLGGICSGTDGSIRGIRVVSWNGQRQIEVPMAAAPLNKMTYNLHRDYQGLNSDDDTRVHQTLELKRTGWRGIGRFGGDSEQGKPLTQWEVLLKRQVRPC